MADGPSKGTISVRPAFAEDLDALLNLLRQLHPRYPGSRHQAETVMGEILTTPGRTLLVAEHDEGLVGTIDLLIVANISHDSRPWAILENLVVNETDRGRGIGKALVLDAVKRAEDAGAYMVQLLSLAHRREAHAFYGRLGFEAVAAGFRRYLHDYSPTTATD